MIELTFSVPRTKLFASILLLLLPMVASALTKDQSCGDPTRLVTKIGTRVYQKVNFTQILRELQINDPGVKHLRARVVIGSSNACQGWHLTVRDEQYRLLQTMTPQDFIGTDSRWTVRVPGATMYLTLDGCSDMSTAEIGYDEYIAVPNVPNSTYYSSQNPLHQNFIPLYENTNNQDKPLGDYVGFLMSGYKSDNWTCSGVLIAPDLFLTNWHCGYPEDPASHTSDVWNVSIIKNTLIDLSWDSDEISREYYATELVKKNQDLDYALLRIRPITSLGTARSAPIANSSVKGQPNIKIIHHPAAARKQISTCQVQDDKRPSWSNNTLVVDFTHKCDTESGSSGAPIFNDQGQLIGLHHLGFYYSKFPGCIPDRLNKAVNIKNILDDLPDAIKTQLTIINK